MFQYKKEENLFCFSEFIKLFNDFTKKKYLFIITLYCEKAISKFSLQTKILEDNLKNMERKNTIEGVITVCFLAIQIQKFKHDKF